MLGILVVLILVFNIYGANILLVVVLVFNLRYLICIGTTYSTKSSIRFYLF